MPRYEGYGPPYNPGPGRHWGYTTTIVHHDAIPAITHEQRVYDKPERIVVYTLKGIPIRTYEGIDTTAVLTKRQKALGWVYESTEEYWDGEDRLGVFTAMRMTFKNDKKKKLGTGERQGFLG